MPLPSPSKTVDVFDPESGSVLQVPASEAENLRQGGYTVGRKEAATAYAASGAGGSIMAGLLGVARGASFHISDLFIPDSLKPLVAELDKQHGFAEGVGEFTGGMLPFMASGGAAAAVGGGIKAVRAARIATGAIGGGIETAVEASKTDSPLTAERLVQSVGINALLAAGAEGLDIAIRRATPAIQRGVNKFIENAKTSGNYEFKPFSMGKQTAAQTQLNKAVANNMVDDLGGAEGIFGPKTPTTPIAPEAPATPYVNPDRTTPIGPPPPLPSKAAAQTAEAGVTGAGITGASPTASSAAEKPYPAWMLPTEEELAMERGEAVFKPEEEFVGEAYRRSPEGEAWYNKQKFKETIGNGEPWESVAERPTPAGAPTPTTATAAASTPERTWADYKPFDFSPYVEPSAKPPPDTYIPQVDRSVSRRDMPIDPDDIMGGTWKKKGERPHPTLRNFLTATKDVASAGGALSFIGNPALAAKGFAVRQAANAGLGTLRLADRVALSGLNNQKAFNEFLEQTVAPAVTAFGKASRVALESEMVGDHSDHAYGGNDPDGTFSAVQVSLPKYAADPHSLNQFYEQRYGHVFNGQQTLYQNFIVTNQQAVQYLNSQMPKDTRPPSIIPRPFDPPRSDKVSFLHKLKAINDPYGALQNPTVDSVAAVEAVYPETMRMFRTQLLSQIQNRKEPLTARQAQKASLLLGQSVDASTSQDYLSRLQMTASRQVGGPQAQGTKPGPKGTGGVTFKNKLANMTAPASQLHEVENTQ